MSIIGIISNNLIIFIGSISAILSFLFSKLEKVVCPW